MKKYVLFILCLGFLFQKGYSQTKEPLEFYFQTPFSLGSGNTILLNPTEFGLLIPTKKPQFKYIIGVNGFRDTRSNFLYYDSVSSKYRSSVAPAYRLEEGESIAYINNSIEQRYFGLRLGIQREIYIEDIPIITSLSLNNIISSSTRIQYLGDVIYTDSIQYVGQGSDSKALYHTTTEEIESRNMLYIPVLTLDVGVKFSLGEKWSLVPKIVGGLAVYDRGKLEHLQYSTIGADLAFQGAIRLNYKIM